MYALVRRDVIGNLPDWSVVMVLVRSLNLKICIPLLCCRLIFSLSGSNFISFSYSSFISSSTDDFVLIAFLFDIGAYVPSKFGSTW